MDNDRSTDWLRKAIVNLDRDPSPGRDLLTCIKHLSSKPSSGLFAK